MVDNQNSKQMMLLNALYVDIESSIKKESSIQKNPYSTKPFDKKSKAIFKINIKSYMIDAK